MFTLIRLQISKRLKFIIGYMVLMLLGNALFSGIMELRLASLDKHEGFYVYNSISILILLFMATINIVKEQYNRQSRWIYLLPIRGYKRMVVKHLWIVLDVSGIVLTNLIFSSIIRILYYKNIDIGKVFLLYALNSISENGLYAMVAIILSFALLSFAIVFAQTIFYQNVAGSMTFIGILMMGVVALICLISGLLAEFIPADFSIQHAQDIYMIIPIFEGGQWNIVSIVILLLTFIFCTLLTGKIMDRYINF